jgi:hypothetical protein
MAHEALPEAALKSRLAFLPYFTCIASGADSGHYGNAVGAGLTLLSSRSVTNFNLCHQPGAPRHADPTDKTHLAQRQFDSMGQRSDPRHVARGALWLVGF